MLFQKGGLNKAFLRKGHLSRDLTEGNEGAMHMTRQKVFQAERIVKWKDQDRSTSARVQLWQEGWCGWTWGTGSGVRQKAKGQIMQPWNEFCILIWRWWDSLCWILSKWVKWSDIVLTWSVWLVKGNSSPVRQAEKLRDKLGDYCTHPGKSERPESSLNQMPIRNNPLWSYITIWWSPNKSLYNVSQVILMRERCWIGS